MNARAQSAAITAHPLCWPEGWPRATHRLQDHPFKRSTWGDQPGSYRRTGVTFNTARTQLLAELKRLNASGVILSCNLPLRLDGHPYSDAPKTMKDPGVAVYFQLKGKPMVMAQDRYSDIAANVRSLGLAIEGMRQMNRHGGAHMMERAFAGFAALPPPEGSKPKRLWWEVMRYPADPEERELISASEIDARFRTLAAKLHPDVGGSDDAMAELNQARADALEEIERR